MLAVIVITTRTSLELFDIDLHCSLQLPLIQRRAAHLIHTSGIEWIGAKLVAFDPQILRLHEMSFG